MVGMVQARRSLGAIAAITIGLGAAGCASTPPVRVTQDTRAPGVVEGGLEACSGIYFSPPLPFAAGTIVVLRGVVSHTGQMPTTVVTSEPVSAGALFHFSLPAGAYVLVGHYATPGTISTWAMVDVESGTTTRVNLPNRCV
ncbi:MAG TPA: hypothetical protein VI434_13715 [Candidatus Dormibacteraeota bacterium]